MEAQVAGVVAPVGRRRGLVRAQCVHGQQMLAGSGTDHAVRSCGNEIPKKRGWILAVNKFSDKLRTRVRLNVLYDIISTGN